MYQNKKVFLYNYRQQLPVEACILFFLFFFLQIEFFRPQNLISLCFTDECLQLLQCFLVCSTYQNIVCKVTVHTMKVIYIFDFLTGRTEYKKLMIKKS